MCFELRCLDLHLGAILSGNIFADVVPLKLKEQWMVCKHEKRPPTLSEESMS